MKLRAVLATCLLAVAPVYPVSAAIFTYDAILGPETFGATGTGVVLVEFDTTAQMLSIDAAWSGLSGSTNVAHIHCCTAVPGSGAAGVAVTPGTLPGFPAGVTAGTYSVDLNLALSSSFTGAFVIANGGSIAGANAALLGGLNDGKAYFNIHTLPSFPGGEIRGFLQACGAGTSNACEAIPVPEPTTLVLFGLGLAGVAASRRHNR